MISVNFPKGGFMGIFNMWKNTLSCIYWCQNIGREYFFRVRVSLWTSWLNYLSISQGFKSCTPSSLFNCFEPVYIMLTNCVFCCDYQAEARVKFELEKSQLFAHREAKRARKTVPEKFGKRALSGDRSGEAYFPRTIIDWSLLPKPITFNVTSIV